MRATIHNGRTSKDGAYNTKHNDRQFDIRNAEHIDPERVKDNRYWNWTGNPETTFEAAEQAFYEKHIRKHLDAQNARYKAQRHAERAKTMDEYRRSPQTCPEEVILQIGKRGDTIPADMMARIIQEQINWEQKQFPGLKVLDVALHMDEQAAPHIHERRAWVYTDKAGNLAISQNKSLEQMGVELPNPNKPRSRFNNRKMTFSRMCREHLLQICRKHGLEIEEIPQEKSRSGREFEDYKAEQAEKRARAAEMRARMAEEKTRQAETSLDKIKGATKHARNRTQRAQEQAQEQEDKNRSLQAAESEIRGRMEREQTTARQLAEMNQKARQTLREMQKQLEVLKPYLSKAEQKQLEEQQKQLEREWDEPERD